MVRFSGPIPTPQAGVIVPADYRLFYPPSAQNYVTGKSLDGPMGITYANNQLIVADTIRILYWNNPGSVTNGQIADGVVGAPDFNSSAPGGYYGRVRADSSGHIYAEHGYSIDVYHTPLASGETMTTSIIPYLQDLEGNSIDMSINGNFVIGGLAPAPDGSYLWVAHNVSHRVIRIRNPLTNPVVDVVLGQANANGTSCNRGGAKALNTLCYPGDVTLDKNGNIIVTDNSLEANGNGRVLEFNAADFPTNNASTIYGINADKVLIDGKHTFEPAFDSQNHMVVPYNDYSYSNTQHSLDYFNNILSDTSVSGAFSDYYAMPYAMTFDSSDNLYVVNMNRWKVMIYKTPFVLPTNTPTNTPSPTLTPTDTLTPTVTPIGYTAPTNTPTDTPTNTPTPTDTPTNTPTPTDTPTITPVPSDNSNNNPPPDINQAPQCHDASPISKPDLFAIKTKKGSAELVFMPVDEKITGYNIIYGLKKGDERFGATTNVFNNNEGEQHFSIFQLNSRSTYYFKVAAANGCTQGPWSDWLSAKASGRGYSYKYKFVKVGKILKLVPRDIK